MFLLYRACSNEFSKNMKALAASQGADVDFEEDWYAPEDRAPIDAMRSWDIMNAAIGLGYSEE